MLVFAGAPYSNSAPLVYGLKQVDLGVEVIHDHPSKLVTDLHSGKADVALVPIVHLFEHPELKTIPGIGVAADGPVRSVLLKCNVPVDQIKTVGRDSASATSNTLAEFLLREHFGRPVKMVDFDDGDKVDAAVVIGDRALLSEPAPAGDIDLAEAWKEMTGLPFVFAMWATRADHPDFDRLCQIAHGALKIGLDSIEIIADQYADQFQNEATFWHDYLLNNICYEMSDRELLGIENFQTRLNVT